jgi:hypothetical protein
MVLWITLMPAPLVLASGPGWVVVLAHRLVEHGLRLPQHNRAGTQNLPIRATRAAGGWLSQEEAEIERKQSGETQSLSPNQGVTALGGEVV